MHDKLSPSLLAQVPVLLSVGKRDMPVRTTEARLGWEGVFRHLANLAEERRVLPDVCLKALASMYEPAILVAFSHRLAENLADLGMGPVVVAFRDGSTHVLAVQTVELSPAPPPRPADWIVLRVVGDETRYVGYGVTFARTVADAAGFTLDVAEQEASELRGRTYGEFLVRERRYRDDGTPYVVGDTPARARALRAFDSLDPEAREALLEILLDGAKLA